MYRERETSSKNLTNFPFALNIRNTKQEVSDDRKKFAGWGDVLTDS